jgi:hypothetical protein
MLPRHGTLRACMPNTERQDRQGDASYSSATQIAGGGGVDPQGPAERNQRGD